MDTLKEFIRWAFNKHGNQKMNYLLILSGHGSGITEEFLERDENSMDSLTIDEFKPMSCAARTNTKKKIDILGMDACFMSMARWPTRFDSASTSWSGRRASNQH